MTTLYSIHADGIPVYLPDDLHATAYTGGEVTPTSAQLTMKDNEGGSFVFSILKDNLAYDSITLISSTIKVTEYVYNDDGEKISEKILWMGRPIAIEDDISGNREITCEGALCYLNDVMCYTDYVTWSITDVCRNPDGSINKERIKTMPTNIQKVQVMRYGINRYLNFGGSSSKYSSEGGSYRSDGFTSQIKMFQDCTHTYGYGYNYMCPENRRIYVGTVDVNDLITVRGPINGVNGNFGDSSWSWEGSKPHDPSDYKPSTVYPPSEYPYGVLNYQRGFNEDNGSASALEQLKFLTVDYLGGHLILRYETEDDEDVIYLDYVSDAAIDNEEKSASYGVNIIEFKGSLDLSVPVTDIIPRGKCMSTYDVEHTPKRYFKTPSTEWVGIKGYGYEGGVHIVNEALAEQYGRIQQVVDFPDIADPSELKIAAEEWLKENSSFLYSSYEVSILDLGRVYGYDVEPVHLLDKVHVVIPGKVDDLFPVTQLDIDLLNPANTTVTFSTTKTTAPQTYSLSDSDGDTTRYEKIKPTDTLSEALINNIGDTKKQTIRSNINSSTIENVKDFTPTGKTGSVTVVTSVAKDQNGELVVITDELLFVNGLLTGGSLGGGPHINYLNSNDAKDDIVFSGIVKPIRDDFMLRSTDTSNNINPYHAQDYILFGSGTQPTYMRYNGIQSEDQSTQYEYYKYPYYNASEVARDLILDTDYLSERKGEYYYDENGTRKYVPIPCLYYIPTNMPRYAYILYISDITEKYPFLNRSYDIIGKKIDLAGSYTYQNGEGSANVSYLLNGAHYTVLGPEIIKRLEDAFADYMPSHTDISSIIDYQASQKLISESTLLISPYVYISGSVWTIGLFITQAIIEPRKTENNAYRWSVLSDDNGRPRLMPTSMRIYTGSDNKGYLPKDYSRGRTEDLGNRSAYHKDMNLKTWRISATDINTPITTTKYYMFASEEDMLAVINDYKEGTLSQTNIEYKHMNKILFYGNSFYSDEKMATMSLNYMFDGREVSYNGKGNSIPTPL